MIDGWKMNIDKYTHTYIDTHTHIYIYIYIYRERERKREGDGGERDRQTHGQIGRERELISQIQVLLLFRLNFNGLILVLPFGRVLQKRRGSFFFRKISS